MYGHRLLGFSVTLIYIELPSIEVATSLRGFMKLTVE